MVNNFLEVFTINLQTIPNLSDVIESGNELIFVVRVTVTLPTNEIRTTPVTRHCINLYRACIIIDCIECVGRGIIEAQRIFPVGRCRLIKNKVWRVCT